MGWSTSVRRTGTLLVGALTAVMAFGTSPASLAHEEQVDGSGNAFHHLDLVAAFPLDGMTTSSAATSTDLAFWGDRVYAGSFGGFRIFDIGGGTPIELADVKCEGAPGDPSVYDTDDDGIADVLILSVNRTMTGPDCSATPTAHDNPTGWEGLRIFSVADPSNVQLIASVYQDCGSFSNTLIPRPMEGRLLVLNPSFPLRPGPTCGPVRGPEAGRDPLHGVVQVVEVPFDDPAAAHELVELPVVYPGDNDNSYLPIAEHGINGGSVGSSGLIDGMRACFDITVFLELNLAAAACAEQAQLWAIDPATGLPDSANPLWVYDQDNVDGWAAATFSWDGRIVSFADGSFGDGCPATTVKRVRVGSEPREYQTGNTFFFDVATGSLLSEFRLPRSSQNPGVGGYCSAARGNVIPAKDRYLLTMAHHAAGSTVIDFTDPWQPTEIAYGDRTGAGTWSTYWYEQPASAKKKKASVAIWANDGAGTPIADRNGFEAWRANLGHLKRTGLTHLNPQVQEQVIPSKVRLSG